MNYKISSKLTQLTDHELIAKFRDLLIEEREQLVLQLEHILELDRRKLFFHYASLWAFLVEEYGMEESSAERRIRTARLMGKIPELKEMLESGKMNLSLIEIVLSCAHHEKLSESEILELLKAIAGMSCRNAKKEVANRYPHFIEVPSDRIRPIHSGFSEITFYASQELLDKLEEIQGLLAPSHPQLQMRELIEVLADDYYERHHPEAKARRAEQRDAKRKKNEPLQTEESPSATKAISGEEDLSEPQDIVVEKRTCSQAIVHALIRRDEYVCSYVDPVTGKKCQSTYSLQIDHVQPWARGGKTTLSNARYLCFNHHRRISYLEFGEVSQYIKRK